MGLYASIYDSYRGRDALSVFPQDAKEVFVVNAEGPFERQGEEPAVMIVPAPGPRGCVRAVPVGNNGEILQGAMKGYSFVSCSDSRFGRLCAQVSGHPWYGAVALHDRCEW